MKSSYEICLSCGSSKDGEANPTFQQAEDPQFDIDQWKKEELPEEVQQHKRHRTTQLFKNFIDSDDGLCVTKVEDWATVNALGTPGSLIPVSR